MKRFGTRAAAVAVAAALAAPAIAQPQAFLSLNGNEPVKGDPTGRLKANGNLLLRPNGETAVYVYVRNPTNKAEEVTVELAAGGGTGDVIGKATLTVPANETARVALTSPTPPKPAPAVPPPPPPAAGEKAAPAAKPSPGNKVRGTALTLRLTYGEGRKIETAVTLNDAFSGTPDYVKAKVLPDRANRRVRVELADRRVRDLIEGIPTDYAIPAALVLDPDLLPTLKVDEGKPAALQATLDTDTPDATLVADGVSIDDGQRGLLALTVDGVERAKLFRTDLSGTDPPQLETLEGRLRFPVAVASGPPVPIKIEVDSPPSEARFVQLLLDRGDGKFQPVAKYEGTRKRETHVKLGGENDGVILTSAVGDWAFPFATTGLRGKFIFKLVLLTERNEQVKLGARDWEVTRTLTVDPTKPAGVTLVLPATNVPSPKGTVAAVVDPNEPRKYLRGSTITLSASGVDPESEIAGVQFFTVDAPLPDGKPAPGGRIVRGNKATAGPDPVPYTAAVLLPEAKGQSKVGVRFVNGVGAAETVIVDIELVDPPAPKTTGTIKGTVTQGDRPQPKLVVELLQEKKVVKTVESGPQGQFEFEDLAPGAYVVSSKKPIDGMAKGSKPATVKAGEETAVIVNVLR